LNKRVQGCFVCPGRFGQFFRKDLPSNQLMSDWSEARAQTHLQHAAGHVVGTDVHERFPFAVSLFDELRIVRNNSDALMVPTFALPVNCSVPELISRRSLR
jgi:hypothetical protein